MHILYLHWFWLNKLLISIGWVFACLARGPRFDPSSFRCSFPLQLFKNHKYWEPVYLKLFRCQCFLDRNEINLSWGCLVAQASLNMRSVGQKIYWFRLNNHPKRFKLNWLIKEVIFDPIYSSLGSHCSQLYPFHRYRLAVIETEVCRNKSRLTTDINNSKLAFQYESAKPSVW